VIEEAFRQVKRAPTCGGGIPYDDHLIPGIARELMLMAPRAKPLSDQEMSEWPDSPSAPSRTFAVMRRNLSKSKMTLSRSAAQKELNELAEKVNDVVGVIDRLSPPTLLALNYQLSAMRKLKTNLRILAAAAKSTDLAVLPDDVSGAPAKLRAKKIAECVGVHYYFLTGKKPTKSRKSFVALLSAVYGALGYQRTTVRGAEKDSVSAYSQAKTLNSEWSAVAKQYGFEERGN
jgi:hypothetical protein